MNAEATTVLDSRSLPDRFKDVEELEEFMTRPSRALIDDLARLSGDIMVLGVGGKMGPTLARLAKRGAPNRRVIGVARFSEAGLQQRLESWGIETISCDLLDREAVERLPKVANIVYMAGRKFGSSGAEHLTWAMNAFVPALVAETFAASRIVAFSTGCVYPFVSVLHQGATEDVAPNPPPGEYANSCVARERVFQHFSHKSGTPGRLIRLNYAIDMRYGVLFDIATRVKHEQPIGLATGHVNVIWQGDANAQALRALNHCTAPTSPINISGPEVASVRALALAFAKRLGKTATFTGAEAETAWLVNTTQATRLFGYPIVPLGRMIDWVADWVGRDMKSLGKDTHFDVRDGVF